MEPSDRSDLDIAHLRSHASGGLPVVIHYEREGGRFVARRAQDAPFR